MAIMSHYCDMDYYDYQVKTAVATRVRWRLRAMRLCLMK